MSEHSDQPSVMTLLPAGTIIQAPDDIGRVIFMFRKMDDAIIFFEYWREVTKAGEQPERCPRCGSEDPAMIGDIVSKRHGRPRWHTSAPPEPTMPKYPHYDDVAEFMENEAPPAPASAPPALKYCAVCGIPRYIHDHPRYIHDHPTFIGDHQWLAPPATQTSAEV